jgi:hypothetical protein
VFYVESSWAAFQELRCRFGVVTDSPMIRQGPIDFKEVGPAALISSQNIGSSDVVTALLDASRDAA